MGASLRGFDQKSNAEERKFELDQDQQFRAQTRRDKLFGQWIAGKLGLSGDAATAYAKTVVESNFEKPGDEDMLDKVRADLANKSVVVPDTELHAKLGELHTEAARQVAGEKNA